jgi:hypothetical protein
MATTDTRKTQTDCDKHAAIVRDAINARTPGLFKVDSNASNPRVECRGVGGVYCGWSTTRATQVEDSYQHFLWEH